VSVIGKPIVQGNVNESRVSVEQRLDGTVSSL
jgi:hypothetical protein